MAVFMTKTWGFSDPTGPLQFGLRGARDSALQILKQGDLVVIVGTKKSPTPEGEHGKILGLMEPSDKTVQTLDYQIERGEADVNDSGDYRWPYGIELRRAWRFDEPLADLSKISNRYFGIDSAQGIVRLTEHEAENILLLPRTQVELLRPFKASARVEGDDLARRKGAPPPSTTRAGIMHMRRVNRPGIAGGSNS